MTPLALPAPGTHYLDLGDALLGGERPFLLPESTLETHAMIAGGTGGGKSRLMQQLGREFLRLGRGFMVIDPHGKLVDAFLGDIAERWDELDPLQRLSIHHLKPSHELLFAFDPFAYPGIIGGQGSAEREAYLSWLESKVDRVAMQVIRQLGATGFQDTPRLERFLKAALYACGVALDETGTHLGLHCALALINPMHQQHPALYARVLPALKQDEEILADFEMLRAEKRPKDQAAWNDSTLSRLRKMLRRLARKVFEQRRESIDIARIMREGGIILCDMSETEFLSKDQADFFGGLFINEAISQARRDKGLGRDQFYLLVDEAERFVGEDLRAGFGELRKMKLSLLLGFQDLSSLRVGELDLVPKVVSQCGVRITFQQQLAEDARELVESLCWKDLDFTPHMQKVYAPRGHEWILTRSVGFQKSETRSWSVGDTLSRSLTKSLQASLSKSEQESHTDTESWNRTRSNSTQENNSVTQQRGETDSRGGAHAVAESESRSHTDSRSESKTSAQSYARTETRSESESKTRGDQVARKQVGEAASVAISRGSQTGVQRGRGTADTVGQSSAVTDSENWAHADSRSEAETAGTSNGETTGAGIGGSTAQSNSAGRSEGLSVGLSAGATEGSSWGETEGETQGTSVNYQLVPLPVTEVEYQDSGRLLRPVQDQLAKKQHGMMTLRRQHCLVSLSDLGFTFVMRVADVADAFSDLPELRPLAIDALKERIYASQPYYFAPCAPALAEADECRVVEAREPSAFGDDD